MPGYYHSTGSISFAPDLILYRPPLKDSLEEIVCSFRKRWTRRPSILGLFYAGWEYQSDVFHYVFNRLDDFLFCPFREVDRLARVQRLLSWKEGVDVSSRVHAIKKEHHLEALVGESDRFLQVIEMIPRIATSDATVLISGETGTGKELVARAIHYQSPRRGKPFIPVNCGALPTHLIENELFGHAKGAYTDASTEEKGLIAEAEGGTLLLDEIDTLSPSVQVKLLRFLQDREYRPLGFSKSRVAGIRIIAATNVDLKKRLEAGLFREDLYHRLNVLTLSLPALRERLEDIPVLAAHVLTRYGSQYGRGFLRLSHGAMQKLMAYAWPGNVRELEGVIHRPVILASSLTLQPDNIDLPLPYTDSVSNIRSLRKAKAHVIEEFERGYLVSLLSEHRGNVTHAARAAGKDRRTFQRLLRKYDLERHAFKT